MAYTVERYDDKGILSEPEDALLEEESLYFAPIDVDEGLRLFEPGLHRGSHLYTESLEYRRA